MLFGAEQHEEDAPPGTLGGLRHELGGLHDARGAGGVVVGAVPDVVTVGFLAEPAGVRVVRAPDVVVVCAEDHDLVGEVRVGPAEEAHHAITVRRAKVGQEVVLFDGSGVEAAGVIARIARARLDLDVLRLEQRPFELSRRITLAVATVLVAPPSSVTSIVMSR